MDTALTAAIIVVGSSSASGGQSLKTKVALYAAGILLSLLFLCSCATEPSARRFLPADLPINKDAGRGACLVVTVQLGSGQKLPFIVDTGANCTLLDKSLEPKLGKPLGTTVGEFVGIKSTNNCYTAPKLYLGGVLLMSGTNVVAWDFKGLSTEPGRPVMGILGMDVLEHYCIQLDFAAGKMRFLNSKGEDKETWGKAFPIVALNAEDGRPAVSGNLFGAQGSHSLIDSGYGSDGWLMPKYFQQWTNGAVLRTNGEACWPHGMFGGEKYPWLSLDEKDFPSDAIGLRFLARHRVTLDFPNHTLYLQRQSIGPLPDPRLDKFKPIRDKEPEVTAHLQAVIQDQIKGTAQADDYTPEVWKKLSLKQKEIQAQINRLGHLVSMTLVDRSRAAGQRSYRYRLEFTEATLLMHFTFDAHNKLASGETEAVEWKAPPLWHNGRKDYSRTTRHLRPTKSLEPMRAGCVECRGDRPGPPASLSSVV